MLTLIERISKLNLYKRAEITSLSYLHLYSPRKPIPAANNSFYLHIPTFFLSALTTLSTSIDLKYIGHLKITPLGS